MPLRALWAREGCGCFRDLFGLEPIFKEFGKLFAQTLFIQEVLSPTPLNPTPATCHQRKRKLRCNFRNVALQKLHCNIRVSAVRKSFSPKAALQQAKNCSATLKKLRCRKVALSCRKHPRLGPADLFGWVVFRGGLPALDPWHLSSSDCNPHVLEGILGRSSSVMRLITL